MKEKSLSRFRTIVDSDPDLQELISRPAVAKYIDKLEQVFNTQGIEAFINELEHLNRYDWRYEPVSSKEFFTSTNYLCENHVKRIHPISLQHLVDICDLSIHKSMIIDTGALGTGKSFRQAHWGLWLLYVMSCLRDPAEFLGIGAGTTITIGITATKLETSQSLAYGYLQDMVDNSPWFSQYFPRDRRMDSKLVFPNKVSVVAESPATSPFIGTNLLAWLGDEVSFLEDTKSSRQERNLAEGTGSNTSKANRLFNKMHDRIISRFVGISNFFGGMYICSSRQYPTDFMETLINKFKKNELSVEDRERYYIIEHAAWDLKDRVDKSKTFTVVIGDAQTGSYILNDGEDIPTDRDTIKVPMEYYSAFENDIEEALRNQAGIATVSVMPLIPRFVVVHRAVEKGDELELPLKHPCRKFHTDLMNFETSLFDVDYLCIRDRSGKLIPRRDPDMPRYIHVDLSKGASDAAGFAMLYSPYALSPHVSSLVDFNVSKPDMPFFVVELMLQITPPRGEMMRFDKICQIPLFLRDRLGFNIRSVSSDSYQSAGMLQALHLRGFNVDDCVSLDRSPDAYLQLRAAFGEGRMAIYNHPVFMRELRKLRWDLKYRSVDHPQFDEETPNGKGSKDVADSVAGALHKLTNDFLDGKTHMKVVPILRESVPTVHQDQIHNSTIKNIFESKDQVILKKSHEDLIDMMLSIKYNQFM